MREGLGMRLGTCKVHVNYCQSCMSLHVHQLFVLYPDYVLAYVLEHNGKIRR